MTDLNDSAVLERESNIQQAKENSNSKDNDKELRKLPHNIEAEQILLGSLLNNNENYNKIGDYLLPEHFYSPIHQKIFKAIITLNEQGLIADAVSLKHQFDKEEALKEHGGGMYLFKIARLGNTVINVSHHGQLIFDMSMRRNLINLGEEIINSAYDVDIENQSKAQIEHAEQSLFNLASNGASETNFEHISTISNYTLEVIQKALKQDSKVTGVSTGFNDLDRLLGGLHRSDLVILAGRPSMGKTAFALNLAVNCAENMLKIHQKEHDSEDNTLPPSVGFFSLEMSSEQLAQRMISMKTGLDVSKLRLGTFRKEEGFENKLSHGISAINRLPFFIDDTPALSISAVRTRARRLKRKHNLGAIFVDYLQLLQGSSRGREMNRVREIDEITQGLKSIAKELDIPVLALSQLSRAVEQREDKKPQLSDLRESGSIEQDADIVLFIYREEYYLMRQEPADSNAEKYRIWQEKLERAANKSEIIVAKHRNGPIGSAKLYFEGSTTSYKDLYETHE